MHTGGYKSSKTGGARGSARHVHVSTEPLDSWGNPERTVPEQDFIVNIDWWLVFSFMYPTAVILGFLFKYGIIKI